MILQSVSPMKRSFSKLNSEKLKINYVSKIWIGLIVYKKGNIK